MVTRVSVSSGLGLDQVCVDWISYNRMKTAPMNLRLCTRTLAIMSA